MPTAKFHVTGENMSWVQVRIQDEIQRQDLEGSAISVGKNDVAVIVEGEKDRINGLYDNLATLKLDGVKFGQLKFGEYDATEKTVRDLMLTNSMDVLIRLLERIEENTREMNRKLDDVLGKKTETTISSEATNSFNSIFGNE